MKLNGSMGIINAKQVEQAKGADKNVLVRRKPEKTENWYQTFSLSILNNAFRRRIFLFRSFCVRGSMTVEACLALPLFLFFMMSILYLFQIIHLQSQVISAMHQEGNRIAMEAYGSREEFEDGLIILQESYQIKPYLFWLDSGSLRFSHRYYGHPWIGYNAGRYAGEDDLLEYVYIAETGTVYHRKKDCTYLDLSVRSVDRKILPSLRNKSGGSYYECDICGDKSGDTCYITDYGSRYHSSPACSGLKRTVFMISHREAIEQGRHACSKCG